MARTFNQRRTGASVGMAGRITAGTVREVKEVFNRTFQSVPLVSKYFNKRDAPLFLINFYNTVWIELSEISKNFFNVLMYFKAARFDVIPNNELAQIIG